MGVDDTTGKLAVFWSDFRNGGPCKINSSFGLPTTPCANYNNDVFAAVSADHGATWSTTKQVTGPGLAAQWQVDLVIVEDTSSGMGLIQLLKEVPGLDVVGRKPDTDK